MLPGMVNKMHVIDARGAGRHARQAGEAPVDMLDHLGRRRAVVLQHVLDQVDAAPRAVELVAEQDVGRACRSAEAAVHAAAQYLCGSADVGVGEWRGGEVGVYYLLCGMR